MDDEFPTEHTVFVLLNDNGEVRHCPVNLWSYTNQFNPNHGLSERPSFAELATHKLFPVEIPPMPEVDTGIYNITMEDPEFVDGKWIRRYRLIQRPYKDVLAFQRSKRTNLLESSDWTQIADVPVDKQAWAAYRQLLRDIPAQPDFPYNIVWPTPPEN